MEIKTKEFQEAASTILTAVGIDKSAGNLEINVHSNLLYLTVANKEYYVSVKFETETDETFRAVVDAQAFLNLITNITAETFQLNVVGSVVGIKAGRSNYKLSMIYKNEDLMTLEPIALKNHSVDMTISNDILKSILNINSKEVIKGKGLDNLSELQKMYYVDETGCFTFTTGACINSFELEKPICLLLNDRIVKLFKLFKNDVTFAFGHDKDISGAVVAKAIFRTGNIYIGTKVCSDDLMLSKVKNPYSATKALLDENYSNKLVLSVNELSAAISRLTQFTKNVIEKANMKQVLATIKVGVDELTITDRLGNSEAVTIENGSYTDQVGFECSINLIDLKLAIDSYKNEHITLNCGGSRAAVIVYHNVSHLIPVLAAKVSTDE